MMKSWYKIAGNNIYNTGFGMTMNKIVLTFIACVALLILITACNQQAANVPEPSAPTFAFEHPEMTINVGDVISLALTAGETEITFSSSDDSIATITPDGTLTAIAEGYVVISSYMGDMSANLYITVVAPRIIEIVLERNVYSLGDIVEFDVVKAPGDDTPYSISVFLAEIADDVPTEVLGNSFVVDRAGLHTIELFSDDISTRIQFIVFDLEEFASEVFILTNAEREKHGLHPLERDEDLDRAAEIRAADLVDYFSHTRPDGGHFANAFLEAGVAAGNWAENLAEGQRMPEDVIADWMDSATHREAMLNIDCEYLGIGIHMDDTGKAYWVQTFR